MSLELSVVIPCYNEAFRLGDFFSLIRNNSSLNWEWIFVDDGSTDQTGRAVNEFSQSFDLSRVHLVSVTPNQGKGNAVKQGILKAKGRLTGYVDADLAASPICFKKFINATDLREGEVILVGARVKTQDGKVERYLYRHLIGRVFQTYVSLITGLVVYDSQCGFKLISTAQAKKIAAQMSCSGFAFDVEIILLALSMGMSIREEMIEWREKGKSSIRAKHILQMLADVWKIRSRFKQGTHSYKT